MSSLCSSDNEKLPNVRQVDYLWFILNPMKEPTLRKRLILNFIKIVNDTKDYPRKAFIQQMEDFILKLRENDPEFERLVKISFNYPGAKRSLIDFSKVFQKLKFSLIPKEVRSIQSASLQYSSAQHVFSDPVCQSAEITPNKSHRESDQNERRKSKKRV